MIYFLLFIEFLKIGLFTFGGAYGAIPLIRQTVLERGWMDDEMFGNMIAISESTPGPIMVNAATYIGNLQGGIAGAAIATLGVVTPSFVIIVLIAMFLRKYMDKPVIKAVLTGMKLCIAGIISATGLFILFELVIGKPSNIGINISSLIIAGILGGIMLAYKKIKHNSFSPILLICVAFVLGIIFTGKF